MISRACGNPEDRLCFLSDSIFLPLSKIKGTSHGEPLTYMNLDSKWKDTLYAEVNECFFFHGSREDKVDAKAKEGIDPRLAKASAVFGQAVYMSESSTKADQYSGIFSLQNQCCWWNS